MTISRLQNAPFDPETVSVMFVAFGRVCRTLGVSADDELRRDIVAKKIINFAQQGLRDADQLAEATVTSFRKQGPSVND